MTSAVLSVALVGNPNCGKTALFNRLTGARHKVANYAGVTVERKEGYFTSPAGSQVRVIDLPGAYSLNAITPDEAITREVLLGERAGEAAPDLFVLVVDATRLRLNLRLVLEVLRLGRPTVVALNMMDAAARCGLRIDVARLQAELGVPVVETVAIRSGGEAALLKLLDRLAPPDAPRPVPRAAADASPQTVARILEHVLLDPGHVDTRSERLDALLLHPVLGYLVLSLVLFLIFQAVFSGAKAPMDGIKAGVDWLASVAGQHLAAGPLRSLLLDGVLSGLGSVLVFLPQILILFFFILALEDSGYLPRAAFLLDRLMGSVGLSGRAFIPLLSSFACAIPGIMATRTLQNPRERWVTIMIAPLMTCSARLPVYALLIGAFIPARAVGWFNLQGLVLFVLYLAGIAAAMAVAWVFKLARLNGPPPPLLLELPDYRLPDLRNLAIGLYDRARIFITRVGSIILALMVLLWALASFPAPPPGATEAAISYSWAGQLGQALMGIFKPIGFNWQIAVALIPGLAAREVAVAALGTVYALSASGDSLSVALTPVIAASWSGATAYSLLAWYVLAPQCLATLSVVRRETGSWRAPIFMATYLFALAWLASYATYHLALWMGG